MPKYTFPDDGSAQHLAGVVVETSEENAEVLGLSSAGGRKTAPKTSTAKAEPAKAAATKDTPKTK
jgi:hypothetical protein